jgi:hypothetical protein
MSEHCDETQSLNAPEANVSGSAKLVDAGSIKDGAPSPLLSVSFPHPNSSSPICCAQSSRSGPFWRSLIILLRLPPKASFWQSRAMWPSSPHLKHSRPPPRGQSRLMWPSSPHRKHDRLPLHHKERAEVPPCDAASSHANSLFKILDRSLLPYTDHSEQAGACRTCTHIG